MRLLLLEDSALYAANHSYAAVWQVGVPLASVATASCSVNCPSAIDVTGVNQPEAAAGCQVDSAGLGS